MPPLAHWSHAQRRALGEMARGGGPAARRAQVLLLTEELTGSPLAAKAGVSAATIERWRRRFLDGGARRLRDEPRSGRPRAHIEEGRLIEAILDPSDPAPSTRKLARQLDTTQTSVVRSLAHLFADPGAAADQLLPSGPLTPVGFRASRCDRVLVLRQDPSFDAASHVGSSVRHWQCVLLLGHGSGTRGDPASDPDGRARERFLAEVDFRHGGTPLVVVSSDQLDVSPEGDERPRWLGLRDGLVQRTDGESATALVKAAHAWLADRPASFEWIAEATSPQPVGPSFATSTGNVHSAVLAMRDAMRRGELVAEHRFSTSWLAERTRMSPTATRQVLRRLQEDGVTRRLHDRGYAVVSPQRDDVLEVYAARRVLGGLLVARAATTAERLDRARLALDELGVAVSSRDGWLTDDADLRFQDALASDSGAVRMASMFHRLSDQLRLFIAALGARYGYSANLSFADDEAIFKAVEAHRPEVAVQAWHTKMARAAGYMVHTLPS